MRSCVQLTHTPTGISISCQDTRSLEQNRRLARRGLAEKVEFEEKGAESKRGRKIEKGKKRKAEGDRKGRKADAVRREIKEHKARLELFRAMPKVELHRHLEGSMRMQTVLEEGIRHKVPLPAYSLKGLCQHYQFDHAAPCADLGAFLAINDAPQAVLCDMESFRRIAREAVVDMAMDGVVLAELRYAPSFCSVGHGHCFEEVGGAARRRALPTH